MSQKNRGKTFCDTPFKPSQSRDTAPLIKLSPRKGYLLCSTCGKFGRFSCAMWPSSCRNPETAVYMYVCCYIMGQSGCWGYRPSAGTWFIHLFLLYTHTHILQKWWQRLSTSLSNLDGNRKQKGQKSHAMFNMQYFLYVCLLKKYDQLAFI